MRPGFAERLRRSPTAATMEVAAQARAMRAAGLDVISLAIGEPDFDTPPHVIEAAFAAARAGDTKYPPLGGTPALKAAIARKFARENHLDYAPDEIMVANGGKQVIFNALMATVDPGDEVVIPAPYWGAYPLMALLAGAEPVPVACPQQHGFKPRPDDLDAAITPRTKWVILNFPNNPTGAVCSAAELAELAAVLLRHPHVWVLCDDIYERLIYAPDGSRAEHVALAGVEPRLRDRVVTLGGLSKTYAMTGWRVGFCGGPRDLIAAMVNMQGQATSGISTVGQAAAVAALDGPQDEVETRAAEYRRRRDLVVDALNRMPGVTCHRPDGAFYVYPHIGGCLHKRTPAGTLIGTDEDFAKAALAEAHVALVPGSAFGHSPHVRVSYASDEASLAEACRRLARFCESLG